MSAFKAVQVFNPHKLATLKPDVSHVNSLRVIPAFGDSELERLKAELPTYIAKADGISSDLSALEWWKLKLNGFAFLVKWSQKSLSNTAFLSCSRESIFIAEYRIRRSTRKFF